MVLNRGSTFATGHKTHNEKVTALTIGSRSARMVTVTEWIIS